MLEQVDPVGLAKVVVVDADRHLDHLSVQRRQEGQPLGEPLTHERRVGGRAAVGCRLVKHQPAQDTIGRFGVQRGEHHIEGGQLLHGTSGRRDGHDGRRQSLVTTMSLRLDCQ